MATVRDLLDAKGTAIFSVGPDDPVLDAIKAMAERHVGALLVMKAGEAPRHRVRARLRPQSHPARPIVQRHLGVADHELPRPHCVAEALRRGLHAR